MTPKKFGIFVGVSLLLHMIMLLVMAYGWLKAIEWQPDPPVKKERVRITLTERPPAPLPEPLRKERPFVDTAESVKINEPDPTALFQSAENTVAMSAEAGTNPSQVPNLTGEESRSLNLTDSNYSPQVNQQNPSPQEKKEQEETQEKQEEQEKKEGDQPEKPESAPKLPRDPNATILTREEEERRKQLLEDKRKQLEALDASQASAPMAFSAQRRQSRLDGGADIGSQNSFGAEQTELGRYKEKLYRAVGSRWYHYVEDSSGLISIGMVKIRFYVRADGIFEKLEITEGDGTSQLHAISRRAIMINSGQLEPFSESMKAQLGEGYWEEISFTIR
ncbi:MAG: hypothetical protein AAF571_09330 [Verrucomicrobiota bacterium]